MNKALTGSSGVEQSDAVFDLLEKIDRVILWLPRTEPRRGVLKAKAADIRQAIDDSVRARDAILCLRLEAHDLRPSSLRTLLVRRVDDLCQLVVFPNRPAWTHAGMSTLAS